MLINLLTLGMVMCLILNQYESLVKKSFFDKLDPKHAQNFREHNFKHCKLYIRVHTRIAHTCMYRRYIQMCTQQFRPMNIVKIHIKLSHSFCLLFKDIKDWQTHKKNFLKNNNFQICEFPACLKNFRIRLFTVRVYTV